jgi:hypothetical protein
VERTLESLRHAPPYIEVDLAGEVLAAAELVATARRHAPFDLPHDLTEWALAKGPRDLEAISHLAMQAADRIAAGSEFGDLYEERGCQLVEGGHARPATTPGKPDSKRSRGAEEAHSREGR